MITKNTRHGTCGKWHVDFRANVGPINLMRAVKAPSSAQKGVGGYHTNIQIYEVVIDENHLTELDIRTAREICKDPHKYAAQSLQNGPTKTQATGTEPGAKP